MDALQNEAVKILLKKWALEDDNWSLQIDQIQVEKEAILATLAWLRAEIKATEKIRDFVIRLELDVKAVVNWRLEYQMEVDRIKEERIPALEIKVMGLLDNIEERRSKMLKLVELFNLLCDEEFTPLLRSSAAYWWFK